MIKMINKILNDNKGFTLVELLVAMVILLIVLLLGYALFSSGVLSYEAGTYRARLQQNVRQVENGLRNELRNAVFISEEDNYHGDREIYELELNDGHLWANNWQMTSDGVITEVTISIEGYEGEEDEDDKRVVLAYEVVTRAGEEEYSNDDLFLLNNLEKGDMGLGIEVDEGEVNLSASSIYYVKPALPDPEED